MICTKTNTNKHYYFLQKTNKRTVELQHKIWQITDSKMCVI